MQTDRYRLQLLPRGDCLVEGAWVLFWLEAVWVGRAQPQLHKPEGLELPQAG